MTCFYIERGGQTRVDEHNRDEPKKHAVYSRLTVTVFPLMEEMMTTKNTLMLSLLLYFISVMHLSAAAGRSDYRGDYQAFDRAKDILICQFDGRPDGDDVMSQAAIGCILMHKDYQDVRSYGVMHAYGKQRRLYTRLS